MAAEWEKKLVRSDLKKLDSFTLETSKNHLIRIFLRNGRLIVEDWIQWVWTNSTLSNSNFWLSTYVCVQKWTKCLTDDMTYYNGGLNCKFCVVKIQRRKLNMCSIARIRHKFQPKKSTSVVDFWHAKIYPKPQLKEN